eukprot:1146349-Pelagomonas_calceolata.AAC.3
MMSQPRNRHRVHPGTCAQPGRRPLFCVLLRSARSHGKTNEGLQQVDRGTCERHPDPQDSPQSGPYPFTISSSILTTGAICVFSAIRGS